MLGRRRGHSIADWQAKNPELAQKARIKGGKRRSRGLRDGELPALDSIDAAKRWLEVAGRACGEGRLTAAETQSVVRAAEVYCKAHDLGELQARIAQLEADAELVRASGPRRTA